MGPVRATVFRHSDASMASASQGDSSFAGRLSPLIARRGVTAVPTLLVRYQGRLGLTSNEVVFLLHVLSHRWSDDHWPWLAVSTVADAAGVHTEVARRWKASLLAKRFISCKPRIVPGIGRRADEYDLSGLFAALEALALEEETQKKLDELRGDLPAPTFHVGSIPATPQLSTGRPNRKLRSRTNETVGAGANANVGAPPAKRLGRGPAKAPVEVEAAPRVPFERLSREQLLEEHQRLLAAERARRGTG
jgi:hypothetical protein